MGGKQRERHPAHDRARKQDGEQEHKQESAQAFTLRADHEWRQPLADVLSNGARIASATVGYGQKSP